MGWKIIMGGDGDGCGGGNGGGALGFEAGTAKNFNFPDSDESKV